jgi:FtsP/CotA-like multicopper oxidase with cupredoxin domain
VPVGTGESYDSWFYDKQYPGPELRVTEGERLRVDVANQLPAPTTIHWHGVPVPNPMDGVPGLTQEPIQSGDSFRYEFEATPSGTYLYHSHVDLQLDHGLVGPLIIEEQAPHVDYDKDVTLFLDDYLPTEPTLDAGNGMGERPPYEGVLINGQMPDDPFETEVEEGQRVRLRFINGSSATTYHVGIGGHQMTVTHADGQPVDPVEVDSFLLSMGERYDVIVEADNPGTWAIQAVPLESEGEVAEAVLQYAEVGTSTMPDRPEFDGSTLEYEDLHSRESLDVSGTPDRTFDLTLSGGMMMQPDTWTIDGQAYPDADPLNIRQGEHVRVNLTNHSMMVHPMHLHGHFFQVGDVVKDTVIVPPHMGQVTFEFVADNPGEWFFHCHNLYHLHSGMARVFEYER